MCLEKCDALLPKSYTVATLLSDCESQQTEQRASVDPKTINKSRVRSKNNRESLKKDDEIIVVNDKKQASVQEKKKSLNKSEVPEKYRDIINKSVKVNLIRYNDIEKEFNTPPKTASNTNM